MIEKVKWPNQSSWPKS